MPTVEQLDAQYRAEQASNASTVAKALFARWMTQIDPEQISLTFPAWMDDAVIRILAGRERAYTIAAAYAQAVRRIQIPGATPISIPRPADPPLEKLRTSLTYTGARDLAIKLAKLPEPSDPTADIFRTDPITVDELERNRREREAWREMRTKAVETSGAKAVASAYKEVVNGGRDTTDILVVRKVAIGYVRITRADPCYFCAMLASRGPVFTKSSFDRSDPRFTGPGEHKVHDSCGCSLRPIYKSDGSDWPERAREFDQLWRASGAKYSGDEAIRAFRRAYEGRAV